MDTAPRSEPNYTKFWARLMRKMLRAEAPPTGVDDKEVPPFKGSDIVAAIEAGETSSGIGELLRSCQEAVGLFSKDAHEYSKAFPPCVQFLPPKLGGAPWAPQVPARKRASGAYKARRRRNDVATRFLQTGQLALPYLRYAASGEIAGACENFGSFGALLTNLGHPLELSAIQNMETASRLARLQIGVVASGP